MYEKRFRDIFGKDFLQEMQAMLQAATLDLRVNTFLKSREEVQHSLRQDGVESLPAPYSTSGLRCKEKAYLSQTKALKKGWIEIQDEGSQLIAQICKAELGMQVLDFCAGAGGKTLTLAAAMKGKGRIVAMDTDERRLQKARQRFKRAGLADMIETRPLSDSRHKKWLRRQDKKFDCVLLDVPCTGTGTWRRNPDYRWKNYGPDLQELILTQQEILEKACHAVKQGGKLIYATCSLLRGENEDQIESFLKAHKEFEISPLDPAAGLGSPYMRLTPFRHKTDGFFAAVLKKE